MSRTFRKIKVKADELYVKESETVERAYHKVVGDKPSWWKGNVPKWFRKSKVRKHRHANNQKLKVDVDDVDLTPDKTHRTSAQWEWW